MRLDITAMMEVWLTLRSPTRDTWREIRWERGDLTCREPTELTEQ